MKREMIWSIVGLALVAVVAIAGADGPGWRGRRAPADGAASAQQPIWHTI
jgi:hypothetical protein